MVTLCLILEAPTALVMRLVVLDRSIHPRLSNTSKPVNVAEKILIRLSLTLQERDPVERIRSLILAHNIATEAELKVKTTF